MEANNMMLNNVWVNNKIKEEIKTYLETNENEDTTIQNLQNTGKTIIRGKFLALQAYQKQKQNPNTHTQRKMSNNNFTFKGT